MKIISDIRLFKSEENQRPLDLGSKKQALVCRRAAMKLREYKFSLGEFDHLYLVFSASEPKGSILLDSNIDSYHPWYRYVYVGVELETISAIENSEDPQFVLEYIEMVLSELFCDRDEDKNIVRNAIEQAKKGPAMLMRYKEKHASKVTATIFLRLLNNAHYRPLLCVTDLDGNEILKKDLPETIDLGIIGEIQVSSKKVTVRPRKNEYSRHRKAISFELK